MIEKEKKNKNREERTRIQTIYGKILTVKISAQTSNKIVGTDLYGASVIIPIEDIHSMVPISGTQHQVVKTKEEKENDT